MAKNNTQRALQNPAVILIPPNISESGQNDIVVGMVLQNPLYFFAL